MGLERFYMLPSKNVIIFENNGQKGGGQEIRERDCGLLTPEVITLDRLGLMLAHHDRCHSKRSTFLTCWLYYCLVFKVSRTFSTRLTLSESFEIDSTHSTFSTPK